MSKNKNRISTTDLIDIIINFCELYSGIGFYPYQEQFARRIVRSVLTNDGNELSALFARQCIPEGELVYTREGTLVAIEDHPDSWVTNESAELLEVRIKGGYTLKCTANHPIMTKKGWINAGLLEEGDQAVVLHQWSNFGKGLSKAKFSVLLNDIKESMKDNSVSKSLLDSVNALNESQVKTLLKSICDAQLLTLSSDLCYARLQTKNYFLSRLFQSLLYKVNIPSLVKSNNYLSIDRGSLNNFLNDYQIINSHTFKGEDGEELKYSEVMEIRKVGGIHKVYDVEYPDKGWFICNGIKVHNSGKSETVSVVAGGLMIILPRLANMPMFLEDPRLQMFANGLMIGIFAPSQRQAQTTYSKIRGKIISDRGQEILNDPDFRLEFTTSNGTTIALNNGSFVTAISASDGSNIEGESFQIIILEECQDISDFKILKCLTGDTGVLLSNGEYKRIDEIVRDGKDELVCYDKGMTTLTSRVPYEFYDNGIQPVYKITLDNSQTIKATLNHKFYTLNKKTRGRKCKFRTVQEIINTLNNDRPLRIGIADTLPYFAEETENDYEKGLLCGYFLGDGCLINSAQFIGDEDTCLRILNLFKKVVSKDVRMNVNNINIKGGVQSVWYTSKLLKSFFESYEMWDKKGVDKYLPSKVFSKSFYQGLVESLIETDGCIESYKTRPIISFSNISEKMIDQLSAIYLKFGIHATKFVRDNNQKGSFGTEENCPLHFLHVKSGIDVVRFKDNFTLYKKQELLNEASKFFKGKETRERSKYYPDSMRFAHVKSIEYVGEEPTYCVNMDEDEDGIHNIILGSVISGQSIHPMGAAYNATVVKIGTATTRKGNFYKVIERNKKEFEEGKLRIRSHFEYDYKVVSKYNPMYAKYIIQERNRLGEKSDEFRMSYCVSPDTKILTSDLRWVRADSIKVGDELTSFDEHKPKRYGQRRFKKSVVEDVGMIERPCYSINLSDGTQVTCSEEHQWLVFTAGSRTQWKQTKDLVSTDRIYKVCDVWDEPNNNDYKLGYLSAAFDGEGCLSYSKGKIGQITLAQRDNPMLRKVKEYLEYYNFDYGKYTETSGTNCDVHKFGVSGGRRELLRFLGTVRPERLLEKFTPDSIGTLRCYNKGLGGDMHPYVSSIEFVGLQKVIPIRTDTRTYIANGLASHNCLEWIFQRGMFTDMDDFEARNIDLNYDIVPYDKSATHVVGIDVGGASDSTVITVCEVDWDMPVVMESRLDEETGEEIMYQCYNTYLKSWCEIKNMPNFEEQYPVIVSYLNNFKVARVLIDATRERALADRLSANLTCEVIPYVFGVKSKSDLYKHFDKEVLSGRAQIPGGEITQKSPEFKKYIKEMSELEKSWRGAHMTVSHPATKDGRDDFCDSHALAVYGCIDEGTVNTNMTHDRDVMFGKSKSLAGTFNGGRNKVTARRR